MLKIEQTNLQENIRMISLEIKFLNQGYRYAFVSPQRPCLKTRTDKSSSIFFFPQKGKHLRFYSLFKLNGFESSSQKWLSSLSVVFDNKKIHPNLLHDGVLHGHLQVSFNLTAVERRRHSFCSIHTPRLSGLYISQEVLATMETQLEWC